MQGSNRANQPSPPVKKSKPALRKVARRTPNQRWLWLVFGLVGVAMISATAGALLAVTMASTPLMQRKLSAEEAAVFSKGTISTSSTNLQLPELTRPVNILVLGVKVLTSDISDDHPDRTRLGYDALVNSFDGLTDTMLMLRFDPATKRVVLLSIPRDTRLPIPGYGTEKINAANKLGGPALTARTTSELLNGVGIDRYVTLNVQGVQALIDALGGVTVHVPKDMKYRDDSQHFYVNLRAGKQHLNGEQALQLLRFRYDENGDLGRIQRQQMVIRALSEQALNPATVARLPKILSIIQSHIDTNLSVEELVALTGFAAQIKRSDMQMLIVPGRFSEQGEYDASYWLPDENRIAAMMAQYFDIGYQSSSPLSPHQLRISIQDSTRQRNAAQLLENKLRSAGYSNILVDLPYTESLSTTRIIAQQGDRASAETVQRSLGFGEVRIEGTGSLDSDVTIQLGRDAFQGNSRVTQPPDQNVN